MRKNLNGAGLATLFRELRSAAAYLGTHRRIVTLVALTLPALAVYGTAAAAAGARAVLKPKPKSATAEL